MKVGIMPRLSLPSNPTVDDVVSFVTTNMTVFESQAHGKFVGKNYSGQDVPPMSIISRWVHDPIAVISVSGLPGWISGLDIVYQPFDWFFEGRDGIYILARDGNAYSMVVGGVPIWQLLGAKSMRQIVATSGGAYGNIRALGIDMTPGPNMETVGHILISGFPATSDANTTRLMSAVEIQDGGLYVLLNKETVMEGAPRLIVVGEYKTSASQSTQNIDKMLSVLETFKSADEALDLSEILVN